VARIAELCSTEVCDCTSHVRLGSDDGKSVAAQFHCGALHHRASPSSKLLPNRYRACERNLPDRRVFQQFARYLCLVTEYKVQRVG